MRASMAMEISELARSLRSYVALRVSGDYRGPIEIKIESRDI